MLVLGAAPDYPARSDELTALLDRGDRVDMIDGRPRASYAHAPLRGARSMPLASVAARAAEISGTGWVVVD